MAEVDLSMSGAPLSFSFGASGFLAVYEIGVIRGFLELAPGILRSAPKIYGASSGSIIAAAVVCELNLDDVKRFFYRAAQDTRNPIIGPLAPGCSVVRILQKRLHQILPENSHQMATGRLYVSLTRLVDGQNVVVSEYSSKEELIQALVCSCFIPIYAGFIPPSFRGVRYVDGGFTNLQPCSDLETAITVSPFTGETDICPRNCPAMFYGFHIANCTIQISIENLCRISYAIFPPNCRVLNDFYSQGYLDAILFLHRNNIFEICSHAKTVEFLGVFSKKELFHAGQAASCQQPRVDVLSTPIRTVPKGFSKPSNCKNGTVHRAGSRLLPQQSLHCPKASAILQMQKTPGLLSMVTRFILQQITSIKPSTRVAWSFCKRLWRVLEEISWLGRQFKRSK
ncbi:patatin-like phospholipase domain-containing protein 1 [Podarcis lilfordi]|uniref:Patatin-like phospholipase domain-containing protein 1 n=1 Tax=Podarcis lilfordi TaxID=74358 RepID=A0AA35KHQ3_9SAUR|nr:patatin-like phospholipase domain-containing protein 1 [Podarcis lilfordi]